MPETLVLDASAGLRAALPGQPGHEEAHACLERALLASWRVVAPDLYLYETGNVVARAQGKPEDKLRALLDAHALAEIVRPAPASIARALAIAAEGKLSYHDAAYLALAEETGGTLWTEDRDVLKRFPERAVDTRGLARRLG